jgi:hypothetical protein
MAAESEPPKDAVIRLHGRGMHPGRAQVAGPLCIGLPAQGRTIVSLQMPVLAKDARYYDNVPVFSGAIPRIEAGIDHLEVGGYVRIVQIAHSCGVHTSLA